MCVFGIQIRGKGYWGAREGLEVLYGLKKGSPAANFVNNPYNYARLQAVLDSVPSAEGALVKNTKKGHNNAFSGTGLR